MKYKITVYDDESLQYDADNNIKYLNAGDIITIDENITHEVYFKNYDLELKIFNVFVK